MAGKLRIIFNDIICGAGRVRLEFERDCTPDELVRNPAAGVDDLVIHGDPNLILSTPTHEGQLEAENGNTLCAELSLQLLDTFQPEVFSFDGADVGIPGSVFSIPLDFGLLSLLTEWDIVRRQSTGEKTPPPAGIIISYFLNDYDSPKMKAYMDAESVTFEGEFVHGQYERGDILIDSEFYQYEGSEKVVDITAVDKLRNDLLAVSCVDGFYNSEAPDPLFMDQTYSERRAKPVTIVIDEVIDHHPDLTEAHITDELTRDDRFTPDPSPYKYLTIFNCGHESTDANRRRAMAWIGFSISDMMNRVYDRAFPDGWDGVADRSSWKFHCMGIPEGNFTSSDSNGYYPYLKSRGADFEPVGHNIIDRFRLLKQEADDQEIWLHHTYSADYLVGRIQHDRFDYAFSNMGEPNGWNLITQTASSLGYRTRLSWKAGKPFVRHRIKSKTPPLVKIPPPIKFSGNPIGKVIDAVNIKPYNAFGKVLAVRRTVTSGNYDNDPLNASCVQDTSKTIELKEPYYDNNEVSVVWNNDIDYFDPPKTELATSNIILVNMTGDGLQVPPFINAKNAVSRSQHFAILGNYPLLVFGGSNGSGDTAMGYKHKMSPEFVYVIAGTVAEMVLLDRVGTNAYQSAYPGLILFAGRDTSDNGKTITEADAPAGDEYDFYRGASAIDIPYADEHLRFYTMLGARAAFEAQFEIGRQESYSLAVPGVEDFENELGEYGYDAIYEGLGIQIGGSTFLITRVAQHSDVNETDIDLIRIPVDLPVLESDLPRYSIHSEDSVFWRPGFDLFWTGSGGDRNYEPIDKFH